MICFPNAKINLGLNITEKRSDGFHNIETVFYPIGWCDALEIIESKPPTKKFNLQLSGIPISGHLDDNLLFKAYQLIEKETALPNIDVFLHKALPMGAGLGGGSADAAFFINLLNDQFQLQLDEHKRTNIARTLGSDCAFFIKNKPVFAFEKGDVFEKLELDLSSYFIAIVYPGIHSNTKDAYSLVKPKLPQKSILEIIKQPMTTWKDELENDFERSIFSKYPEVQKTKQLLYDQGAIYASMSGSGSAVFGIFNALPDMKQFNFHSYWSGKL